MNNFLPPPAFDPNNCLDPHAQNVEQFSQLPPPDYHIAMQEEEKSKSKSEDAHETPFLAPSDMIFAVSAFSRMIEAKTKNEEVWKKVEKWAGKHQGWALRLMARWYEEVENDYQRACDFYMADAALGNARSQFMVGHLHIAHLKPRNVQRAVFYFKQAIRTDSKMADAHFALGCICNEGYDIAEYIEYDAVDFWKLAARQGHGPAQKKLRACGINDMDCFPSLNTTHILC